MTERTLLNKIRLMREGANVERCHRKPHLMRYSVGHHTCDVVSLVILCWQEAHGGALPRAELLVAAQVHDTAGESITGDIPGSIKGMLGDKIKLVDQEAEEWLGLNVYLTQEEEDYLHAADKLEFVIWAFEEAERGNASFNGWIEAQCALWEEKPMPPPFMDILDTLGTWGHLTNKELNEIGGLS